MYDIDIKHMNRVLEIRN